ncbi:MAG TPA: SEC-C metal-binding domain-containing protein, partial [Methylomirabilota bacterium]|nr:SEC-C metal-binding domain-containing protein [Methylomirabilota bacterium]
MSGRAGRRKVGRNDPCPCGSGQKYKRCHGTSAPAFDLTAPSSPLGQALKAKVAELQARQLQR